MSKLRIGALISGGGEKLAPYVFGNLARYSETDDCGYEFAVDYCSLASEAVEKIRAQQYDAVVIDTWPEAEQTAFWLCRCLNEQFGPERPVKIIIDFASFPHCIEAMREYSVWDYIIKSIYRYGSSSYQDLGKHIAASAIEGLKRLDWREELEEKIGGKWLPENLHWIQETYGGRLVAIWPGEDRIVILFSGQDAFELEQKLFYWREKNPDQEPFIVRIPKV